MIENWLNLELTEIKEHLSKVSPPPTSIDDAADEVISLHESLRPAFMKFWNGDMGDPGLIIEGWSYTDLRQKRGLSPTGAWLYLSWLMKNPGEAKAALSVRTERVEF